MAGLTQIQSKIVNIGELLDIVGAIRSLAAVRVQQSHEALVGVRRYTEIVGGAIARAVGAFGIADTAVKGDARGPRCAVVFCSEHGLVGGFNERIVEKAAGHGEQGVELSIVGARGALVAEEHGLTLAWTLPMATHAAGALETARRAATEVYRRIDHGTCARVDVIYAKYVSGTLWPIQTETLFPLDLEPFANVAVGPPPLHNLDPAVLMEGLVAEFMLAELTRAALESFASENGARLQVMESAFDNVGDKLAALRQQERRLRQEQTTTELLDVVTGSEALKGRL